MLTFLRELVAHSEWANAIFFQTWGKSPARDHEELRRRVAHIVGVQDGLLAVVRGETAAGPPDGPPPTYDDLKARAQASHAQLREFAAALDAQAMSLTVRVPWFPEPPCVITVAQALVQIAMHSQHHRGQCMTRLKDFGGEPKNVDWIIWLWKQKPAGRWS
ncbi:MAG: DinB family protein [Planctomycetaceae bacterium]